MNGDGFALDARRGRLVERGAFFSLMDKIDDLEELVAVRSTDGGKRALDKRRDKVSPRMRDCLADAVRAGGVIRRSTVAGFWKTAAQEWSTGTVKALAERGLVKPDQGRYLLTEEGRKVAGEVARA